VIPRPRYAFYGTSLGRRTCLAKIFAASTVQYVLEFVPGRSRVGLAMFHGKLGNTFNTRRTH
jgi:hypothetical protein